MNSSTRIPPRFPRLPVQRPGPADPRSELLAAWHCVAFEVRALWESESLFRGEDAPWLPSHVETPILDHVDEAIRAGDAQGAKRAMDSWKSIWLQFLEGNVVVASELPPTSRSAPAGSGKTIGADGGENVKISEIFHSGFLKASDLENKPPITVEIEAIGLESFRDDGSEPKPCLAFVGCRRRLSLNRTNAETLGVAFGDETDLWPGRKIVLSTHTVMYQGRPVAGIKVDVPGGMSAPPVAAPAPLPAAAPAPPAQPAPGAAQPPAGDFGDMPF